MQASESLIKAVVSTAEVMGTELSADGARVFCADLSDYAEPAVMKALTRCRREVRGRLTLADVIARIDDGRPGAEEAWAMLPRSEADTAVWTDEMRQAYSVCATLLGDDDVAARMSFKQAYERLLSEARASRTTVKWSATLGHDPTGREPVLAKAVELGRISVQRAMSLLPGARFQEREAHQPAGIAEPVRALLESMKTV